MTTLIEKYLSENNHTEALEESIRSNNNYLTVILSDILLKTTLEERSNIIEKETSDIIEKEKTIIVKLLCNWTSSEQLCKIWNKLSKGDYTWNNIKIVWESEEPDYYVVINATTEKIDKKKTIVFRMEPHMERNGQWGEWAYPDEKEFLKVCFHDKEYNNTEWHLSKTYTELLTMKIVKTIDNRVSTVLSDKYKDAGHIKRIDFVKFLDTKEEINVDVFGNNKWNYKNYKGDLPYHCKDNSLLPYKYTFNAENHKINNYFTEKIIDGILAESLVFYWGCDNLRDFIDKEAYVQLDLSNFEIDYKKIQSAIKANLWENRLPYILKAKKKILEYFNFFPRLERIINEEEMKKMKKK